MASAKLTRKTNETDISVFLSLDGGPIEISTGVGFFDHMLNQFATHGGFGLKVNVAGDLHVDAHHTVEDTGIVIGKTLAMALNDKTGVSRYGSFFIPMDESLVLCAIDLVGRPCFVYNAEVPNEKVGEFDSCLCEEFFRSLAMNAGITVHLQLLYGKNTHHIIEAMFKAFGHALSHAIKTRDSSILSTKGVL